MKSIFLKLSSFRFGAARRHCPFTSIIHKPISFLFALIFFSLHCFLVPVSASASPIFQPVYDTQLYQLPQFVDPLTGVQHDIFYFILGSQLVEYAGLSGYQIENPYSDPESVGEWFKKIGYDLYNDVLGSYVVVGAPIISAAKWLKDMFANIAGAANFAGYFNNTSFNEFLDDVDTNGLGLQLQPEVFQSFNQYFAHNGGLYEWQVKEGQFTEEFTWKTNEYLSGTNLTEYNNAVENLEIPRFLLSQISTNRYLTNIVGGYNGYRCDIWVDTTNHYVRVMKTAGSVGYSLVCYDSSNRRILTGTPNLSENSIYYDPNSVSSYGDLVQSILNHENSSYLLTTQFYTQIYPRVLDFVDNIVVGPTYASAVPIEYVNTLNFDDLK